MAGSTAMLDIQAPVRPSGPATPLLIFCALPQAPVSARVYRYTSPPVVPAYKVDPDANASAEIG